MDTHTGPTLHELYTRREEIDRQIKARWEAVNANPLLFRAEVADWSTAALQQLVGGAYYEAKWAEGYDPVTPVVKVAAAELENRGEPVYATDDSRSREDGAA